MIEQKKRYFLGPENYFEWFVMLLAVANIVMTFEVWPLTQIFLFPFYKKSLICLKGKSMTPGRGNTILFRSSQQLPRLRLGPSKDFLS